MKDGKEVRNTDCGLLQSTVFEVSGTPAPGWIRLGLERNAPGQNSLPSTRADELQVKGQFPPTHWSVVTDAGRPGTARADAALERICQLYWYPLYAFVRRRGYGPEDAQDLTQAFFARLIEKNYMGQADQ